MGKTKNSAGGVQKKIGEGGEEVKPNQTTTEKTTRNVFNEVAAVIDQLRVMNRDLEFHRNYMAAGGCEKKGCLKVFDAAFNMCNPDFFEGTGPDNREELCAKATNALRRCMESDPAHFKGYIRAMDEGLEEDERREASAQELKKDGDVKQDGFKSWDEEEERLRWWTGMRRS